MTKLTRSQAIVLAAAAQRPDGAIYPLPTWLKAGAATKVVNALVWHGFAERMPEGQPIPAEKRGPTGLALRITGAGLDALARQGDA